MRSNRYQKFDAEWRKKYYLTQTDKGSWFRQSSLLELDQQPLSFAVACFKPLLLLLFLIKKEFLIISGTLLYSVCWHHLTCGHPKAWMVWRNLESTKNIFPCFYANVPSLNESIGYVNLTDCNETLTQKPLLGIPFIKMDLPQRPPMIHAYR